MNQMGQNSKSIVTALLLSMGVLMTSSTVIAQSVHGRGHRAELLNLVNQVTTQLKMAHRGNLPAYRQAVAQLNETIAAWNDTEHTDANLEVMFEWLRQAIQASIPGSSPALPPTPRFAPRFAMATPKRLESAPDFGFRPRHAVRPDSTVRSEAVLSSKAHEPAQSEQHAPVGVRSLPKQTGDTKDVRHAGDWERKRSSKSLANSAGIVLGQADANSRDYRSNDAAPKAILPLLSADDPFRDDPIVAHTSAVGNSVAHSEHGNTATSGILSQAKVNLQELRAKIIGFDRGLRNVESKLLQPTDLSPAELVRLADVLNDLISQRDFVELYLLNLSSSQRKRMPVLRSPDIAVGLLSDKVTEHRHALRRGAPGSDRSAHQRDLLLLQQVDRKLTSLGVESWPE